MAKREMSSTLKNLKFMQRGSKKEEPPKKEEEVKIDPNFASIDTQKKKCIVVMEGNPHPSAVKGRMSFQSFNPSIDKLNEAAANPSQSSMPATTSLNTVSGENGSPKLDTESGNVLKMDDDCEGGHKRKEPETQYPNRSPGNLRGEGSEQSSTNKSRGSSQKKQKRDKLDWNLLRPPKAQNRQS